MDPSPDPIDVEAIVASLPGRRLRSRRRRPPAAGGSWVPEPGLAAAVARPEVDVASLRALSDAVQTSTRSITVEPGSTSRVPGGSLVHAGTARVIRRHTGVLADTVRDLGGAVTASLAEAARVIEQVRIDDERSLAAAVHTVDERSATIALLSGDLDGLDRRLRALEAAARRTGMEPQ